MNSSLLPSKTSVRNAGDLLANHWHAIDALAALRINTIRAFETAWPTEEDSASISIEQRQAELEHLVTLIVEGSKAIQELVGQNMALIHSLHMVGIAVPDPAAESQTSTSAHMQRHKGKYINKVIFNKLRAFFNLDQWPIGWYNLATPQAIRAKHRQAVQILGDSPVNEGAPMSAQMTPPLAHTCIPLPASVIPWCKLSSHLAKMSVQAWGFVYMDAATNQAIGLQAVLARDMPKLFAAASNTLLQDGWRTLEWVDIMPHAVEPEEYENAVLAAMQRRRHYLHNQMIFLDVQIAAQQIKANQPNGGAKAMQGLCLVAANLRQQLQVVENQIAQNMPTLLGQPPTV